MIITSTKNEKIKDLKKQKENKFLLFLDNPKTIREAISSGLKLNDILISEDKKQLIKEFVKFNPTIVSNEVISTLTTTKTPQGIIAVFDFPKQKLAIPNGNFLVLDTVQDAGNVGTLLRSAKGAGFNEVFLIDSARLTNDKTIRSSMGAIFGLKIFETTKQEFLQFAKNIKLPLFVCDMDGESIYEIKFDNTVGLILGNEGNGVSKEIANLCEKTVKIPMQNNLESLNVAVAGSIIMFEITKGR